MRLSRAPGSPDFARAADMGELAVSGTRGGLEPTDGAGRAAFDGLPDAAISSKSGALRRLMAWKHRDSIVLQARFPYPEMAQC